MYQILFLDDEPQLLSALRRMLSPMRSRWEMHFCTRPSDALSLMHHVPFDAVITDMRMPEMDGATFLTEVNTHFPGVLRVILTGHAEKELLLRSIDVAHLYLSKPCDGASLVMAITHALDMRTYLKSDTLRTLINGLRFLPVLPDRWHHLVEELDLPTGSLKHAADLIEQDPFLLASILHVANSVSLSMDKPVSRALPALQHLGVDIVKPLILKKYLTDTFQGTVIVNHAVDALWERSGQVALYAYRQARDHHLSPTKCDRVYAAGLLHLIGSAVLIVNYPNEITGIERRMAETGRTLSDIENSIFSASGNEVGAYLLGIWSMPSSIVDAVAFSDNPSYSAPPFSLVSLLRAAKQACDQNRSPSSAIA